MVFIIDKCFTFISVGAVITTHPMNQTVVASSNVSFTCAASGLPRPTITWFFISNDGSIMVSMRVDTDNFTITSVAGDDERQVMSTLTFYAVQPYLSGTYTCNVSNEVDQDSAIATLTVHSKE